MDPKKQPDSDLICEYVMHGSVTRKIQVRKGNLCFEKVDAITNAANGKLKHYGGLAYDIVKNGGDIIQDESTDYVEDHGRVPVGECVKTSAGKLFCKYVIHTVGPVWDDGKQGEKDLLATAVVSTLTLADASKLESVSLPAISSGIFGFPVKKCARILLKTTIKYFTSHPESSLRVIRFTNIDIPTVKVFADEFVSHFGIRLLKPELLVEPANEIDEWAGDLDEVTRDNDRRDFDRDKRSGSDSKGTATSSSSSSKPKEQKHAVVWKWFWRSDGGNLYPYDNASSDILEAAFLAGTTQLILTIGSKKYHIDLDLMKQRNSDTKVIRDVCRLPLEKSAAVNTSGDAGKASGGSVDSTLEGIVEWWNADGQFSEANSAKLEELYQRGKGGAKFLVNGKIYKINFTSMTRTDVSTGTSTPISRKVLPLPSTSTSGSSSRDDRRNRIHNEKKPVAAASSPPAEWLWNSSGDKYTKFDSDICQQIEAAYSKREGYVIVMTNGQAYRIDLRNMEQVNETTGTKRKVKRSTGRSSDPSTPTSSTHHTSSTSRPEKRKPSFDGSKPESSSTSASHGDPKKRKLPASLV